eukprot:Nk52_evm11s309 gene=Nk52_evmTU11s309
MERRSNRGISSAIGAGKDDPKKKSATEAGSVATRRRGLLSGTSSAKPIVGGGASATSSSSRDTSKTLGGVQKKSFMPTIPAVRRKKKDSPEDAPAPADQGEGGTGKGAAGGGRRGRGRDGNNNRGKKKELIQTMGTFSSGPANVTGMGSGGGGGGGMQIASAIDSSIDSKSDLKKLMERSDMADLMSESKAGMPVNVEAKTTSATSSSIDLSTAGIRNSAFLSNFAKGGKQEEETDTDRLMLLQLPHFLPLPKGASAAVKREDGTVAGSSSNSANAMDVDGVSGGDGAMTEYEEGGAGGSHVLSGVPEGLIGKLRVHESGKLSLKIGDVVYNVMEGAPIASLHSLVSISPEEGEFVNLGELERKLIVVPDIDRLCIV